MPFIRMIRPYKSGRVNLKPGEVHEVYICEDVVSEHSENRYRYYLIKSPVPKMGVKTDIIDPTRSDIDRTYQHPDLPSDYSNEYVWVAGLKAELITTDLDNNESSSFLLKGEL
jgi:hypothetical protein